MTTKIITILIGQTILILGLNYGSPIELTTQPGHRIGTVVGTIFLGFIFFIFLRQSWRLKRTPLRITGIILTVLIALPYLYIGLWTVTPAIFSEDYPVWQDIRIYQNKDGETIIGQFKEISGSIHAYQNRKVIYDFENGIRLSYIYPDNKINGSWTVHNLEFKNAFFDDNDTVFVATFENGKMKK